MHDILYSASKKSINKQQFIHERNFCGITRTQYGSCGYPEKQEYWDIYYGIASCGYGDKEVAQYAICKLENQLIQTRKEGQCMFLAVSY